MSQQQPPEMPPQPPPPQQQPQPPPGWPQGPPPQKPSGEWKWWQILLVVFGAMAGLGILGVIVFVGLVYAVCSSH
ncbi:MAG TPA: hypothetical protein VIF15_19310 [Polyangiaceae bacterium]